MEKSRREQAELMKMQIERRQQEGAGSDGETESKKRRHPEGERDDESLEQERIRAKVEQLRKVQALRIQQQAEAALNSTAAMASRESTNSASSSGTTALSAEDQAYRKAYQLAKEHINSQQNFTSPLTSQATGTSQPRVQYALPDQPPDLDVRVRMIFEEDLTTMIFPLVKQFVFRVARDTPFEVAAKAIAKKNGHQELWQNYSFSVFQKEGEAGSMEDEGPTTKQVQVDNLTRTFGRYVKDQHGGTTIAGASLHSELICFYKITTPFKSPFTTPSFAKQAVQ
ncbi:hypothetical protein FGO68_gene264 [Halteria grandinella]|uniref:Uncharacterized protein n=1 Tax=Halteria grandinella TaxID=5974 RepID=A0A8J8T2D4_HALGN|nr:hypothetical protein FGO68_gene264 [Halteria grandinella]